MKRALAAATVAVLSLLAPAVRAAASTSPAPLPPHPKLVHSLTAAIEPLAPYVPQNDCDPTIKRGTAELGALLSATYPDIYWSSTRPCDGSVSEHHDGRAIDWMASVRNAHTHLEARSLISWLLANGGRGYPFAMARRLGVMYLIYNGRMWGAWDGQWQEYNNCRTDPKLQSSSYDDYCHRSHVHISLSWNGARGLTSFWTGAVRPTDYGPCPPPGQRWATRWTAFNPTPCS